MRQLAFLWSSFYDIYAHLTITWYAKQLHNVICQLWLNKVVGKGRKKRKRDGGREKERERKEKGCFCLIDHFCWSYFLNESNNRLLIGC